MSPHDEHLTPEEIEALGALLVAERPAPSEAFAAELDERVARRFADPPPQARPARAATLRRRFRIPTAPAFAATLAAALVAVVLVVGTGDEGGPVAGGGSSAVSDTSAGSEAGAPVQDVPGFVPQAKRDSAEPSGGRTFRRLGDLAQAETTAGLGNVPTRKVERSARVELGTEPDRLDDVADDVLGIAARFGGIVDRSAVDAGATGGDASFELRVPTAKLPEALAALSRIRDADVLTRSDQSVDVNQAYTSIRRQLANARAERRGLLRALAAADTEDETLRLRWRLDAVERTIARAEASQRALDRRIDYSRISVTVLADGSVDGAGEDDGLTIGGAFDDAGRVLEVAAAVVVIAAAALIPAAALLAIAWLLAAALRRRRREQALDAA